MDNQKLNIKPKAGYGLIYCYTSPSGKKYIGQTKTTLKTRAKKDAKGYKNCPAFFNAIQKYGWDSFSVDILDEVPYDRLNETETYYILFFDTINPNKGYNINTEQINVFTTINCIPVFQYDADTGKFIARFESISEAERAIGVYCGSIRRVVNSKDHTVHNCFWKTEKFDSVSPLSREKQKTATHVYMYDSSSGDFMQEFSSIREAARQTGYNRCTIQEHVSRNNVVRGKKHTFRNFKVDNLNDESSTTIRNGVDSSESK